MLQSYNLTKASGATVRVEGNSKSKEFKMAQPIIEYCSSDSSKNDRIISRWGIGSLLMSGVTVISVPSLFILGITQMISESVADTILVASFVVFPSSGVVFGIIGLVIDRRSTACKAGMLLNILVATIILLLDCLLARGVPTGH